MVRHLRIKLSPSELQTDVRITYTNDALNGAPRESRTPNLLILSQTPLPIGLLGHKLTGPFVAGLARLILTTTRYPARNLKVRRLSALLEYGRG